MIKVSPFKALRPTRDKVNLVGSRNYVEYTEDSLLDKLNNNPYTFLHVINPDFHSPERSVGREKFEKIRDAFQRFVEKNIFIEDKKECFYLYQQQTENHLYTGIIGGASVEDYLNGKIKKHENTLSHREEMFKEYLDVTGFNAEPVLLLHQELNEVSALIGKYIETRAEYEFSTTDKVIHYLWVIENENDIKSIQDAFAKLDEVYIADGHHRSASSALLGQEAEDGSQAKKSFMAFYLSEKTVKIHEFNRLVKSLGGLSKEEFITKVSDKFLVKELPNKTYKPEALHEMSMYLDGVWYALYAKPGSFNPENPVESLDCYILSENLLSEVLGIEDLRTDNRVSFLPGDSGPEGLMQRIDSGEFEVGFGLLPVSVEQLKEVADAQMVMPPKSTYIEPKLRSGITIYDLNDK